MGRRIALFGGAFDPPHLGHQAVCLYLLTCEEVDAVWWIPNAVHAFGKRCAPFPHRVAMCELATRLFSEDHTLVSSIEDTLAAPQCTVDTVARLQSLHPDNNFAVVIGSDNLEDLHRWKEIDRLREMAPFIVVPRRGHAPGAEMNPLLPEVSSREIRARLARGELDGTHLDREVARYIRAHRLYHHQRTGGQA